MNPILCSTSSIISHPCKLITIPFEIANPRVSYLVDNEWYTPSYFSNYFYKLPYNIQNKLSYYDKGSDWIHYSRCNVVNAYLPRTSKVYEDQYFVKIFNCTNSQVVEEFDSCLASNKFTGKMEPFDYISKPKGYYAKDLFYYKYVYEGTYLKHDPINYPFSCYCFQNESDSDSEVEATSLLKGFGGILYGSINLATWNIPENTCKEILTEWTLEIIQIGINFTPLQLILSFIKLIKRFVDVTEILRLVTELFTHAFKFISNKFSQQPSQETVEATFMNLEDLNIESLLNVKNSIPAFTSVMASLSVIFGALILNKNVNINSQHRTVVERVAVNMTHLSKITNGISTVIAIAKNFSAFIYQVVFDLLGLQSDSHLVNLVRSSSVPDTEHFKKEKIFEYSKYLLDPLNLMAIQSNSFNRDKMEFCYNVISDIRYILGNNEISVTSQCSQYLVNLYNELKKVRDIIRKSPVIEPHRMCPYFLMFFGNSGTGKSTYTTIFVKQLMAALRLIEKKKGINLEIPTANEELYYSANFADKFETFYRGQYSFLIDDIFQDNDTPEINSALKMIQYCSNLPLGTVQAGVTDKGLPFTSKIVIATTNDGSLHSRKEIKQVDALINRICMAFSIELPKNGEDSVNHRFFKNNVVIKRYDYKTKQVMGSCLTPDEVLKMVVKDYIKWFEKEKKLDEFRIINEDEIKNLVDEMYDMNGNTAVTPTTSGNNTSEVLSSTKTINRVEETSNTEDDKIGMNVSSFNQNENQLNLQESQSWKCYFGMVPNITAICDGNKVTQIYDCKCEYHNKLNTGYILSNPGVTIKEYEKHISEFIITTNKYDNMFSKSWKIISENMKSLYDSSLFKLIVGATTALAAGYLLRKFLNKTVYDKVESSGRAYSTTLKKTPPRPIRIDSSKVEATVGFEDITNMFVNTISHNSFEILTNSIMKNGNMCMLQSRRATNTGVRICGTAILTNHHFMNLLEEGEEFLVKFSNSTQTTMEYKQVFNPTHMYRIGEGDLVVYKCDSSLPMARNILNHFPNTITRSAHTNAVVLTCDPLPISYMNIIATPNVHKAVYTVGDESYDTLDSYITNCPTNKGMSGSILFSLNNKDQHKIIGIQICRNKGEGGYGYFKPVSQDDLKKAVAYLEADTFESSIENIIKEGVVETCNIIEDKTPSNLRGGNLQFIGIVPKTKRINQPSITKLEPSLIQDPNELTQLPSVLSDYDPRMDDECYGKSVIYRSIEGFSKRIGSVCTKTLEQAVSMLKVEYDVKLNVSGIQRRVLNNFEMINGIPNAMLPLDMKTSPGYPLILERAMKGERQGGKFRYFKELQDIPAGYGKVYEPSERLLSGLEQAEQQLKEGKMPSFISYCCLKDETRPIAKIKKGKTRAFICLPLIFNLLIRKYFGAFTSAMKQKAVIISSCVGVNPATDWVKIYDKLKNKNSLWEDFDYANWDQYLHPELVMRTTDIINSWYDDGKENARIRRMLIYNLIHTPLIVKSNLFVKSQGQCSGCAITAELNCLVHDLLMTYVWIRVCKDQGKPDLITEMRNQVALCVYGDDIIMAVDKDCEVNFNGTIIAPIMDQLGMNITPGDKVSTEFTLKEPKEIFFLKRNFIKNGEKVLAPLRMDVVENIPQWVHKSDDKVAATYTNINTALRECYMHSRSCLSDLTKKLNERIKKINMLHKLDLPHVYVDYDVLDAEYHHGSYACAGLEVFSKTGLSDSI